MAAVHNHAIVSDFPTFSSQRKERSTTSFTSRFRSHPNMLLFFFVINDASDPFPYLPSFFDGPGFSYGRGVCLLGVLIYEISPDLILVGFIIPTCDRPYD